MNSFFLPNDVKKNKKKWKKQKSKKKEGKQNCLHTLASVLRHQKYSFVFGHLILFVLMMVMMLSSASSIPNTTISFTTSMYSTKSKILKFLSIGMFWLLFSLFFLFFFILFFFFFCCVSGPLNSSIVAFNVDVYLSHNNTSQQVVSGLQINYCFETWFVIIIL